MCSSNAFKFRCRWLGNCSTTPGGAGAALANGGSSGKPSGRLSSRSTQGSSLYLKRAEPVGSLLLREMLNNIHSFEAPLMRDAVVYNY